MIAGQIISKLKTNATEVCTRVFTLRDPKYLDGHLKVIGVIIVIDA